MSASRERLISAALGALLALASPTGASAQDHESSAADVVDDIIVTAQRREQSLQDVPIAVTAIGASELDDLHIPDPAELTRAAPSISIATAQGARTQIGIRGIGTQRFDIGSDSPIGVFVDDVYRARFADISSAFFDLERIEILRGPQDILFGRNTPGGALSIITADPTATPDASADLSYGSENTVRLEGAVSGPLGGERARFRLAGLYNNSDGFFSDPISGHTSGEENLGARARLDLDITPDWTARISADWRHSERDLVLIEPGPQPRFLALPFIPFSPTPDPYSEPMNYPGFVDREGSGVSLELSRRTSAFDFTSLSAYRTSSLTQEEDFDYTIVDVGMNRTWEDSDQVSQEFRLSSTRNGAFTFDGRFEWLVGAFFYRDDAQRVDQLNFSGDSVFNPFFSVSPAFVNVDLPADITTESWAIFGQAGLRLTEQWELVVGARYTEDTKDFRLQSISPYAAVLGIPPYDVSGSRSWDAFDPKITINYHASDDLLVYMTWSEGFKSGGFQFAASHPAVAQLIYDPEYVTAFEIGVKSDWFDRRLRANLAAFDYDYQDQQVQSVIVVGGLPTVVTTNAAQSEIWGAEADITAVPVEGLSLSLRYAYLHAVYDRFIQDPFTNTDLSGFRMPRTPENSVTFSVSYERPIEGPWSVFAGAELFYTDGFESSSNEDPTLHIDSYHTLSARVGLQGDNLRMSLFGVNLTDEVYRTYAINQGPARNFGYGDPATYGLSLSYRY